MPQISRQDSYESIGSVGSHDHEHDDELAIFEEYENGRRFQDSDAQEQWEESLQQIQDLLTCVLVPVIGKFLGRRCAYYNAVWAKVATYKYGTEPKISTDAAFVAAGAVESVLSVSI